MESQSDEKPPIFKNWQQMYLFVIIMHAVIISLFYWFTASFS